MNRKLIPILLSAAIALSVWGLMPSGLVMADGPSVVISQVYGGGGNAGATYRNDYVELYNRGTTTVSLSGWSIQYASAAGTGNFFGVTSLSASIAPGQYYLVQLAGGSSGGPLPTPDATGTVNMNATAGKVILANTITGLVCNGGSTPCDASQLAQIMDLVGYGNANFYEGALHAPTLSNTTADFRSGSGCTDTNNNGADFAAAAPNPRNSSSPASSCTCNSQSAGNWSNPANWSCGNPASTALVVIHNGHIMTLDANANVSNLDINAGGALVISGNVITATGTLTNSGTLTQSLPVVGNSNVDFFNTGNYHGITLNANGSDLGSTTVAIKGNQACNVGDELIHRCFNIIPANATGRNATIRFYFASSEVSGLNDCNTLEVYHWNGAGWDTTPLTRDATYGTSGHSCSASPYSLQVTGVTTFSPFGIKSGTAPNAITLREIKATPSSSSIAWLVLAASIILPSSLLILRRRSRAA